MTIIAFKDDSGDLVPVKAVDNGDGTYSISVDAEIVASGLTIGSVDVSSIAAGDNNIGNVDLASAIPAGENYVGKVGGFTVSVDATPTLTVASGYVTGDYVGTSGTPITFSGCGRVNGGSGFIVGALVVDAQKSDKAGELWLFDNTVTPPNDSAAWSISDADAIKCIGIIPFGGTAKPYYDSALNGVCPAGSLTIAFKCQPSSQNLYGCYVVRDTATYADQSLTFRLRVIQD